MQKWNYLFWISAGISAIGAIVFIVGTDTDVEEWGIVKNLVSNTDDKKDKVVETKKSNKSSTDSTFVVDMNNNNNSE